MFTIFLACGGSITSPGCFNLYFRHLLQNNILSKPPSIITLLHVDEKFKENMPVRRGQLLEGSRIQAYNQNFAKICLPGGFLPSFVYPTIFFHLSIRENTSALERRA